jgi:hypothetical protein
LKSFFRKLEEHFINMVYFVNCSVHKNIITQIRISNFTVIKS